MRGKFQNVFGGMKVSKDTSIKKDLSPPPSGRSWTEEERETYYKDMRSDFPIWKNETLKLLYERRLITLSQHTIHKSKLEDKLWNGFKNGYTPEEFIENNPKLND